MVVLGWGERKGEVRREDWRGELARGDWKGWGWVNLGEGASVSPGACAST